MYIIATHRDKLVHIVRDLMKVLRVEVKKCASWLTNYALKLQLATVRRTESVI